MTSTISDAPVEVEQTPREQLVAGLHALADFLAANPDVPVIRSPTFQVNPALGSGDEAEQAAVAAVAELLGVEVVHDGGHTTARRMFGPVEYKAVAVSSADMNIHRAAMAYSDNLKAAAALAADAAQVLATLAEPVAVVTAALTPDDPSLPDSDPWAGLPVAATKPDPHANCPLTAGPDVTCDRCGRTYRCGPDADYYCAVEGDHCCESCLIGGRPVVVVTEVEPGVTQ